MARNRSPLTQDEINSIRADRAAGLGLVDIATKHGVSYGATHRACSSLKYGQPVVPPPIVVTEPKSKKPRAARQYEIAKFGGVRVLHTSTTPGEVIGLDVIDADAGQIYTLRVMIRQ